MQNRRARPLVIATALAGVLGCGEAGWESAERPAARPSYLAGVPWPPGAVVTDTTGAEDAARLSFLVQLPLEQVARFYRDTLPQLGWQLRSDVGDATQVSLYLTRGRSALWVQARRLGNLATAFTLIGAGGEPADTGGAGPPGR
jgi:hypothetical protein